MASRHKHGMIATAIAGTLCLGTASAQAPAPSAAPPPPSPAMAAPVQQTPPPATPSASAPLQNPSAAPAQSPGMTGTPAPLGSTTLQNPNLASSPIQMPSVIPSKAETAPSAFGKLAASGSTFVTKDETDRLDGFDRAFSEADRDKDGKLTKDEFDVAWAIYTGRT